MEWRSSPRNRNPAGRARRLQGMAAVMWLAISAAAATAQNASLHRGPYRLEITVERLSGSEWQAVDPRMILEQNDRVRFRVTPNFSGYLYVTNHSTSGDYVKLFPREETGQQNWIAANQEYVVPATQGAFRVSGPPGHEIVYWMVSPTEFGAGGSGAQPEYKPLPPPPDRRKAPPNLLPRCDDTILRARGDCVDTTAGPKAVDEDDALPKDLEGPGSVNSRQLLFLQKKKSSVVSAPPTIEGPVIFEFRLAHR